MATRYAKPLIVGGLALVGGFMGYERINQIASDAFSLSLIDKDYLEMLTYQVGILSAATGGLVGLIIDKITPNDNKTLSKRLWIDDATRSGNLK